MLDEEREKVGRKKAKMSNRIVFALKPAESSCTNAHA